MPCKPMSAQQLPLEQKIFSACWRLLKLCAQPDADMADIAGKAKEIRQTAEKTTSANLAEPFTAALLDWAANAEELPYSGDGPDDLKAENDILMRSWDLVKRYAAISLSDDDDWDELIEASGVMYDMYQGTKAGYLSKAAALAIVNYAEANSLLMAGAFDSEENGGV